MCCSLAPLGRGSLERACVRRSFFFVAVKNMSTSSNQPEPRWFVARDKQRQGPYSAAELQRRVAQGELNPGDMVLLEGGKTWTEAASIGAVTFSQNSQDASPARFVAFIRALPVLSYLLTIAALVLPLFFRNYVLALAIAALATICGIIGFAFVLVCFKTTRGLVVHLAAIAVSAAGCLLCFNALLLEPSIEKQEQLRLENERKAIDIKLALQDSDKKLAEAQDALQKATVLMKMAEEEPKRAERLRNEATEAHAKADATEKKAITILASAEEMKKQNELARKQNAEVKAGLDKTQIDLKALRAFLDESKTSIDNKAKALDELRLKADIDRENRDHEWKEMKQKVDADQQKADQKYKEALDMLKKVEDTLNGGLNKLKVREKTIDLMSRIRPDLFAKLIHEIDQYALAASRDVERSIPTLAKYLVRNRATNYEKVRAIARWVADRIQYDVEGLNSGNLGDNSALAVLKNRKAVCEGYANLFLELCKSGKVEAIKISGLARSKEYTATLGGKRLAGVPHSWNATKIDGRWRLLDVTWSAGDLRDGKTVKEFDEYYFLPSHKELIFTHFPNDPTWQLLSRAVTLKEFESIPDVDSGLFRLGITPEQVRTEVQKRTFKGFPRCYGKLRKTKIIEAPLGRYLKAGESYTFRIASKDFPVIAATYLGTGHATEAQRKGTSFEVTVKVQPGTLHLAGGQRPIASGGTLEGIMEYIVE